MQAILHHSLLFRYQKFLSVIVTAICIAFATSMTAPGITADTPAAADTASAATTATPTPSPTPTRAAPTKMTSGSVIILAVLATAGLVVMWIAFWSAVKTHPE